MRRLIVVGAGGIGGGIGGALAHHGFHVELVQRGAHGRAIREGGLRIRRPGETFRVAVPCMASLGEVVWRPDDAVLVATKLYDAEAVYRELARLAPHVTAITAQNGVDGDRWARACLTEVVETVVWVPAEHLEPGTCDLYGVPIPGVVDVSSNGTWFAEWLREAGFRSTVRADLGAYKHAKWVTNLCGTAVALGHEDWIPELMAEGRAVMEAAGLPVVSHETLMAYVGDISVAPIEGQERLRGGSSHQGLVRGRPSEVPWLNGPIVALAREHGVPVPRNAAVLQLAGA